MESSRARGLHGCQHVLDSVCLDWNFHGFCHLGHSNAASWGTALALEAEAQRSGRVRTWWIVRSPLRTSETSPANSKHSVCIVSVLRLSLVHIYAARNDMQRKLQADWRLGQLLTQGTRVRYFCHCVVNDRSQRGDHLRFAHGNEAVDCESVPSTP